MLEKLQHRQFLNSFLGSIPSLHDYLKVRHHLKNKLVNSELDKGKGLLHFCCQSIWASHTKRTYWENHSHFLHCPNETIQSIEEKFANFYDDEELSSIAKFSNSKQSKGKSVPYLYIMAKLKDVNKVRPLASYFHHNLKYVYRYTSMALALILKQLEVLHFNLFKTFDTLPTLQQIMQDIDNHIINTEDLTLSTYAGDIKNLFTELPHDEVERAVIWALKKVQSLKHCRGRNSVTLNLKCKSSSRIGPSYDSDSTITISFEKIFKICKFDMDNAYFYIHDYILKQILGIPQGSPLSPTLAQCCLIFFESQFLDSIYDNTYFFGLRYFDDVRLLSIAYSNDQISRSKKTIEKFIKHLPPSLVLEPEFSGHSFYFLECLITFTPPTFMIIYLSKNYAFYKQYQKLKFYSFQNFYSYHSDRELVASNNLRSKFSAISKYCNSEVAIHISVLSWFQDFVMADYPAKLVIKILKEFYFKSSKPVWKMLAAEIHLDYNFREDIFSHVPSLYPTI